MKRRYKKLKKNERKYTLGNLQGEGGGKGGGKGGRGWPNAEQCGCYDRCAIRLEFRNIC